MGDIIQFNSYQATMKDDKKNANPNGWQKMPIVFSEDTKDGDIIVRYPEEHRWYHRYYMPTIAEIMKLNEKVSNYDNYEWISIHTIEYLITESNKPLIS